MAWRLLADPSEMANLFSETTEIRNGKRSAKNGSGENQGFTLFDFLMLLSIVLILGTISVEPIRQGIQAYKLDQATRLVLAKLERARSLAQARGTIAEVELDAGARTIQITDSGDPGAGGNAPFVLESGFSIKSPGASIRFFPRGYARGGTVILGDDFGNQKSITITASGSMQVNEVKRKDNTP